MSRCDHEGSVRAIRIDDRLRFQCSKCLSVRESMMSFVDDPPPLDPDIERYATD